MHFLHDFVKPYWRDDWILVEDNDMSMAHVERRITRCNNSKMSYTSVRKLTMSLVVGMDTNMGDRMRM